MPKAMAFEIHHRRYDEWFVRHAAAYQSELLAVRALLPWRGLGLDIGVGTGRFAAPLMVMVSQMLQNFIARSRWPGYYSNV